MKKSFEGEKVEGRGIGTRWHGRGEKSKEDERRSLKKRNRRKFPGR